MRPRNETRIVHFKAPKRRKEKAASNFKDFEEKDKAAN